MNITLNTIYVTLTDSSLVFSLLLIQTQNEAEI